MSTKALAIFELTDISSKVKLHLNKVYGTLSVICMAATISCLVMPAVVVKSLMFVIASLLVTIGLLVTMLYKKGNRDHGTKFLCLVMIAALDGAYLKPLVAFATNQDPMIVVNALIYTAAIFVTFSLISLKAERRSMLFVGGLIFSIALGHIFGLLFSWMTGFNMIFNFSTEVINLFIYSLYVIYDTQIIIEKAYMNDYDYTFHALLLFIDLITIFKSIIKEAIKQKVGA